MSDNNQTRKRYYWRGRLVSEKVYKCRLRQSDAGKKLRKAFESKNKCNLTNENNKETNQQQKDILEERRIIHLDTLAEQLICHGCGAILSLIDIESEERIGLASLFTVKCRSCHESSTVSTDIKHQAVSKTKKCTETPLFDVNTRAAMGIKKDMDEKEDTVILQNTKIKSSLDDDPEKMDSKDVEKKSGDDSETADMNTQYFESENIIHHYTINIGEDFSPDHSSEFGDDANSLTDDPLALEN